MTEHLNSNSPRHNEMRSGNNEQHYAAEPQRARASVQQGSAQTCKCGLDTGTRGWRYLYQTH